MIAGIRSWAMGVVISVMITVVIEMILPENSTKKYIKIIIGIFIVYAIISPIFESFSEHGLDSLIDNGEQFMQANARFL